MNILCKFPALVLQIHFPCLPIDQKWEFVQIIIAKQWQDDFNSSAIYKKSCHPVYIHVCKVHFGYTHANGCQTISMSCWHLLGCKCKNARYSRIYFNYSLNAHSIYFAHFPIQTLGIMEALNVFRINYVYRTRHFFLRCIIYKF